VKVKAAMQAARLAQIGGEGSESKNQGMKDEASEGGVRGIL
jgi:hypothetical protein